MDHTNGHSHHKPHQRLRARPDGITFFFLAQVTVVALASASIAAILVCLSFSILIAVLSARILKENLDVKQLIGIGIASASGILILARALEVYFVSKE